MLSVNMTIINIFVLLFPKYSQTKQKTCFYVKNSYLAYLQLQQKTKLVNIGFCTCILTLYSTYYKTSLKYEESYRAQYVFIVLVTSSLAQYNIQGSTSQSRVLQLHDRFPCKNGTSRGRSPTVTCFSHSQKFVFNLFLKTVIDIETFKVQGIILLQGRKFHSGFQPAQNF